MTEKFLKVENVEYSNFQQSMKKVESFFNSLLENGEIQFLSNRYKKLIDLRKPDFNFEEIDRRGLAETVSIKPKYRSLFFASPNGSFSNPFISNFVEEKFDIIAGDTKLILPKLQKLTFI